MQLISPKRISTELQLVHENGQVSLRTVSYLLREPLSRWGFSPKKSVIKHVRDQLRIAGLDDTSYVNHVLDHMIALGECVEVYVGNEIYITPAESRWMPTGDFSGAYLGVSKLPEGISVIPSDDHLDIVQRIYVPSDDDAAQLNAAGIREVSIDEWLSPVGYLQHVSRRLRRPVRSDSVSLEKFWDILMDWFVTDGMPISSDAEFRVLSGKPGQFFGRYHSPEVEGRWTETFSDGTWCAVRRGYGEKHWHPMLLEVNGTRHRALDLYDLDEWNWALLARGKKLGADEVVLNSEDGIRLTFPLPKQLSTAMDLIGCQTAPWFWNVQIGAPNLMEFIK